MIFICEKVSLQQLPKKKIFNTSLNIALFSFFFLQNLIPTCAIHHVNLMVFLYLALNMEKFYKNVTSCDFILPFFFEQDHICMCMYVLVHTFTYIKVI